MNHSFGARFAIGVGEGDDARVCDLLRESDHLVKGGGRVQPFSSNTVLL